MLLFFLLTQSGAKVIGYRHFKAAILNARFVGIEPAFAGVFDLRAFRATVRCEASEDFQAWPAD
ncbi:hypothetical protein [Bradyrhizobium viridifuturi]|uniref:hypothetical protein n=1 Tax=Bradyrhizobium viridifuturi TaxID=1654716 RepID=UPI001FCDF819|nr:hypothetical protein [Bradyrhizobium viridifuturi]